MSNYIIKKVSIKKAKVNYPNIEGYIIHPKKYDNITKIAIYDEDITNQILLKKLNKDYKKIVTYIYNILNEDTGGNALQAYTELDRLKHILLYKYQEKIDRKILENYFKKLSILEMEINKLMLNMVNREEIKRGSSR